jgi:hypothetical protein
LSSGIIQDLIAIEMKRSVAIDIVREAGRGTLIIEENTRVNLVENANIEAQDLIKGVID